MNGFFRSGSSTLATIVAVALTLLSFYFHLQNLSHAGALWRDEVNTVELASEPTIKSIYSNLEFDSFPVLWFIVLRNLVRVTGSEDHALRAIGLCMGLLTLCAIWINARLFGHRAPVLALFLIGCNAAVIRYGDSIRGYGLGILTGTLMFGALWNLTRRMNAVTVTLALFCALIAVHSLFYNAVFLFAVCMGGVAVMLLRRSFRGVIAFLGIGLICAASLAIYIPSLRAASNWNELVRYDLGVSWFSAKWEEALEMSGSSTRSLWTIIFLLGCATAAIILRRKDDSKDRKEIAAFCVTTLLVGLICYVGFLWVLRYATEPWYYLTLMALTACCLDPLFGLIKRPEIRIAMATAAAIVGLLAIKPVLVAVRRPHTNIDLLAAKISHESSPNDLVFVFPWQNGVSFQRYYRGPARWETIPPLGFHRWHRYDLFKAVMSDKKALGVFLSDVEKRLSAGGRVWIIAPNGLLENPHPKLFPEHRPRLPKDDHLWRMRLSVLLSNKRKRVELFKTGTVRGAYENLILDVGARHPTPQPDVPAKEP